MTELRELLERSVDANAPAPDLGGLASRVRGRRRRRFAGSAASAAIAVTALAIAVSSLPGSPVAPQILGGNEAPAGVGGGREADAERDAPLDEPLSAPAPEPADPQAAPVTDAAPVVEGPAADEGPAPRPDVVTSEAPADPPPTDEAPGQTRPSVEEGCFREFRDGPCTYTATHAAGYESDGAGDWSITIERGGQTITINGEVDPICGGTGTIQPGDRVTIDPNRGQAPAVLTYGSHSYVAAGTEYGTACG